MGLNDTERRKDSLRKIVIRSALFCALLIVFYGYTLPIRERHFLKEISVTELSQMGAQEYLQVMSQASVLLYTDARDIEGWPRKEDLPYLLSRVESWFYSGTVSNKSRYIARSMLHSYGTTEGVAALYLLKAIKDGQFSGYGRKDYPRDKDEIIAWARAEAEKMNAEQALKPR